MSDDIPPVPAARLQPSASYSFTTRLHMPQQRGAFARVAQGAPTRIACSRRPWVPESLAQLVPPLTSIRQGDGDRVEARLGATRRVGAASSRRPQRGR